MNIAKLNTASLDDKTFIIKRGTSGGSTLSKPKYTGHADAEGLRAIGWTDEDIAYYQENGVNWNEEDDQYHLVSDDNKALYGVLTADNISTYKDRIVYLPKIDTSDMTWAYSMFSDCYSLVAIPALDTSNVKNMSNMFNSCYSLVSIPALDTSKVTDMGRMFYYCYSLVFIPALDTREVKDMNNMFTDCRSLVSISELDTSNVKNMSNMFYNCYSLTSIPVLDTSSVTNMSSMFYNCYSLTFVPDLDTSKLQNNRGMFENCKRLQQGIKFISNAITSSGGVYKGCNRLQIAPFFNKIGETSYYNADFGDCYMLRNVQLYGLKLNCPLNYSLFIDKDSILYLINNEAATSAITIKLHSYAYERLATDPDVVAALANHPNISLAK